MEPWLRQLFRFVSPPCDGIIVARSLAEVLTDYLEEKDLIIIGGGVAGYVAAIKAGQEGLKVCATIGKKCPRICVVLADLSSFCFLPYRSPVSRSVAPSAVLA